MHHIKVDNIVIGNDVPLVLMAGPCLLESRDHAMMIASKIKEITSKLNIPFIFKTSFDKANRTSIHGKRGVGIYESLEVFKSIKESYGCPVLTDVHESWQCEVVAPFVDIIQIPAFLSRQTDLLSAAADTKKTIHVKKGQFLAPWDMIHMIKKLESFGCKNILLCERGASFGYNTLIVDMRSIAILAKTKYPVIFDATHSVQQPGGEGSSSGGNREMAPILARAAIAVGVAGVFIETHEDPDNAPSDGPNMIYLKDLKTVLEELLSFDKISKKNPRRLKSGCEKV
ncbi:MAG: 3-deoxy-8-phosphooctulonate synthase [Alphaproteobacteria bacterium]